MIIVLFSFVFIIYFHYLQLIKLSISTLISIVEVIDQYKGHESLAYGVDWQYDKQNYMNPLIASCSFYDHSLQLWTSKL